MTTEFSEVEIMLLEKEITKKGYNDIAFLLDRPVEQVVRFVSDFILGKNIIPFQLLQEQKRMSRPQKITKPRQPKKKEPVITSRMILQERKPGVHRRHESKFKTKVVDYTQMILVRVDDKTCVYAMPGDDHEAVREKYKKLMKKNSPLRALDGHGGYKKVAHDNY